MDGLKFQTLIDRGYDRRTCEVSGLPYWSCDPNRTTSGDTDKDPYTFIGHPILPGFDERGHALKERMREAFLSAFEATEHTQVEPYPVLAP